MVRAYSINWLGHCQFRGGARQVEAVLTLTYFHTYTIIMGEASQVYAIKANPHKAEAQSFGYVAVAKRRWIAGLPNIN